MLSVAHQFAPGHPHLLAYVGLLMAALTVWRPGLLLLSILGGAPWALGLVFVAAALVLGPDIEGQLLMLAGASLLVYALWAWLTERVWLRYGWGGPPC